MAENTKFAWNCMDVRGRAACHMRGVPFSTFGVPFAFSHFLKNVYFVYDHETLS